MHSIQRERTGSHFSKLGIERALICNPPVVKWLTGFAPPAPTGPTPFLGGPPLVWYEDGEFCLIVENGQLGVAAEFAGEKGCRTVGYQGYSVDGPIEAHRHLKEALTQTIGGTTREVAADLCDLPSFLLPVLGDEVRSIDGWSEPLRRIKTEEELEKIRENVRLTGIGQSAAREAVRIGAEEMDVYLAAYAAIHRAAGEVVPIGNDFLASHRQNNIGGLPTNETLSAGDSCIVDISTVKFGYWSDSCETYYVGEPSALQLKTRRMVAQVLEVGIDMLRPGVRACDIDHKLRTLISDAGYPVFPHHTGHGIGVTGHESPRIVPYNKEILAPGMVIMLEPGIYFPGELAVRLEHAVLVREDGPEVLTNHIMNL